ncbi:hypothetical protein GCM10011578_096430 [Streptomyces fuscichromogenes]|uniref:Uncharacterized protein n=1 Tax=Streptomyces fuscichromogenes TaxID=1324013 RepID=A0A918CXS5_9ACTN|nr:hypothetical protein GCM10011578_096430 [Streptomyces fuscichromogenes]
MKFSQSAWLCVGVTGVHVPQTVDSEGRPTSMSSLPPLTVAFGGAVAFGRWGVPGGGRCGCLSGSFFPRAGSR